MTDSAADAITTLNLLQALHDHQRAFDASTGWDRISLRTPWQILRDVYSEEAVAAAYTREASAGHLGYGTCFCSPKCGPCVRKGPPTRLTSKGLALLRSRTVEG